MKESRFTPEQIVQALRRAEGGTVVGEICITTCGWLDRDAYVSAKP